MKRLPYIDEYALPVAADRATTWNALLRVMCRDADDPTTVPFGFTLEEATPSERFALKGRHWFSTYRLVFVLDELSDGAGNQTRIAAQTWAEFPGLKGRAYRAMVIGSGGHRIVVARMLKRIATQANQSGVAVR